MAKIEKRVAFKNNTEVQINGILKINGEGTLKDINDTDYPTEARVSELIEAALKNIAKAEDTSF